MRARIATTNEIRKLNEWAVENERNRALSDEAIESLDPAGTHILTFSMIHNDVEMRTQWMFKVKGQELPMEAFIDISFELFDGLTEVEYEGPNAN